MLSKLNSNCSNVFSFGNCPMLLSNNFGFTPLYAINGTSIGPSAWIQKYFNSLKYPRMRIFEFEYVGFKAQIVRLQQQFCIKTRDVRAINKLARNSRSLLSNIAHRQDFSTLYMDDYMDEKYFDPIEFDVLIKGIKETELHNEISKRLGKSYLQPLKDDEKQYEETRAGISYGYASRGLIAIPTRSLKSKPIWIHYLIDPVSPYAYLSLSAIKALNIDPTQNTFQVSINGRLCICQRSSRNFEDVNLLGMNYLINKKKTLAYDLQQFKILLTDNNKA